MEDKDLHKHFEFRARISTVIFWGTIIGVALRDLVTDDTAFELYAFVCTWMLVALVAYVLLERRV
jgi:hypothetical protein